MNDAKTTLRLLAAATIGLTVSAAASAAAMTVYANNGAPGDTFTNAGTADAFQAVGATGWYYGSVRNGGSIGVNTANPQSGNASVAMSGNAGPGGNSSKADIVYGSVASMGAFSSFTGMSYDWYRNGTSTNASSQHPSLRILLDRDGDLNTTADRGSLIFEAVYNDKLVADTDKWVSSSIGSTTKLWNTGFGGDMGFAYDLDQNGYAYDSTLAQWKNSAQLANALIIGFSSGFGSGWGPFSGAVDNISWTIGEATTTTNFEVQASAVPEPGTLALVGLSLAGLAVIRRRKS